jgi:pyruvate/2-oxoglutarate dehydrogenase complex dihydrolipoamide dehydrogenase (E3) component/uncharacterized membrane protein YdjX (TVP38/TMEM64 family)
MTGRLVGSDAREGMGVRKLLILGLLLTAAAAFVALDLGSWLSVAAVKARLGDILALKAEQPWLVMGAYALVYVVATALSVPGAAVLTLVGGALFGLGAGTVIVSLASTMGATLAFLAARYLLRDVVEARFGPRIAAINRGVEKDGAFYLFSLRLVPVFPFFLVNLVMGLTRIRLGTYALVSQIGMLPATIVYVNAGRELGRIEGLAGIVSPGVLGAFAALAALPWLGKLVVARLKARRIYARWRRPARFDRNMVVIGGGAAGLVSAYIAATVGAKVTLVEAVRMGGDCLNTGCVPSKALIRSAKVADMMRHGSRYGLKDVAPDVPFREVMARVRAVIREIEPHDSVERYTALGVDVVMGRARIVDPWTVEIAHNAGGVQRLTTRSIVIAAGAAPLVPPLPGLEDSGYLTSETLWDALAGMDSVPRRVLVLGGGPIGCELAQALARLGAGVTLVEKADRVLAREDEEVSALTAGALAGAGVKVLTGHEALRCEGRQLVVSAGGGEVALAHDVLIVALGRAARLSGYGLEELGIETDGTLVTDDWLATLYPNIHAAGDVAGPYQFTHVAAHQAWYASVNALFGDLWRFRADYRVIPRVTFLDPEVARVGLNEAEAKAAGVAYEVTRYGVDDLDRAIADSAAEGFVKVLTVPGKDRILGVTIVAAGAGEMLAEYVLAMKHGLGLNKVLGTIHAYPTMVEANKYAAGEWKRAHKPDALLRLVKRYHDWRRG